MFETERPDPEAPEPESLETQFWAPRPVPRPNVGRGGGGARDRLHEWRSDPRVGVVALVLIAVVAGFIWYRMGLASGGAGTAGATTATTAGRGQAAAPTRSRADGPAGSRATTSTTATGARASAKVVVHVAGAVTKPGVVELRAGARVIDAVEAAGGALSQADLDRLNLAAKLVDGQRVLVQKVGDPPAVAEPAGVTGSRAQVRKLRVGRSISTPRRRPSSKPFPASGPPWPRRSSTSVSTAAGSVRSTSCVRCAASARSVLRISSPRSRSEPVRCSRARSRCSARWSPGSWPGNGSGRHRPG